MPIICTLNVDKCSEYPRFHRIRPATSEGNSENALARGRRLSFLWVFPSHPHTPLTKGIP